MLQSKFSLRLLLVAASIWLAAVACGQSLEFKLTSSTVSVRQAHHLQVLATVRNTGTTRLYLNQLSLSVPGAQGVDLGADGFGNTFEGPLEPGATKSGPICEVDAAVDAPVASRTGVLAILGGTNDQAATSLAQQQLSLKVEAEPAAETRIVSGLAEGFASCTTSVTFGFVGSDNETAVGDIKYQWRIDDGVWTAPSSATEASFTNLGQGPHKFEVAAIDGFGKVDLSPATRNFTVDLRPLEITVPAISEISADGARCVWRTNRPGSTKVEYRKLSEEAWKSAEVAERTDSHVLTLTKLDSTSDYRARFVTVDDCGNVKVSAELPFRTLRTKVLLATPDVNAISLKPGVPFDKEIFLKNIADVELDGLRATIENLPANVSLDISPPARLGAGKQRTVVVHLLAADETILTASPRIRIVSSDGDEALVQLNLEVIPRRPRLDIVGALDGAMIRGVPRVVEVKVTNTGDIAATNVRVAIPLAPWLNLASPAVLARLAPGESTSLTLNLTPADDQPFGSYTGTIALKGDNVQATVPFNLLCASTAKGVVRITATDEATYFTNPDQKVVGARVVLTDRNTRAVVAEGVTDDKGVFTTEQIPEAAYNVEVTEAKHGTFTGVANVTPGGTAAVETFMTMNRLTYTWSVVPNPVEDGYLVDVDATFETNVPAPVVTVFPAYVDVNTLTFDDKGDAVVRYTITNHGLIALNDCHFEGQVTTTYTTTPQIGQIGTLPAGTSIVVPGIIHKNKMLMASTGEDVTQDVGPCDIYFHFRGVYNCGPIEIRPEVTAQISLLGCLPSFPIPDIPPGGGGGGGGGGLIIVCPANNQVVVPDCKCLDDSKKCQPLPPYYQKKLNGYIAKQFQELNTPFTTVTPKLDVRFCWGLQCVGGRIEPSVGSEFGGPNGPTIDLIFGDFVSGGPLHLSTGSGASVFTRPSDGFTSAPDRSKFETGNAEFAGLSRSDGEVSIEVPGHGTFRSRFDDMDFEIGGLIPEGTVSADLVGYYRKVGNAPEEKDLSVTLKHDYSRVFTSRMCTQTFIYSNGDKLEIVFSLSDGTVTGMIDLKSRMSNDEIWRIDGYIKLDISSVIRVNAKLNGIDIESNDEEIFDRKYIATWGGS